SLSIAPRPGRGQYGHAAHRVWQNPEPAGPSLAHCPAITQRINQNSTRWRAWEMRVIISRPRIGSAATGTEGRAFASLRMTTRLAIGFAAACGSADATAPLSNNPAFLVAIKGDVSSSL